MRAVKSRNTAPEMLVRRIAFSMNYRYRLHDPKLPGKPDLIFPARRKIIFVHGCFWHGHSCTRGNRMPKTNTDYWQQKIWRNRTRDAANIAKLEADGWHVLTIWECTIKNPQNLADMLRSFLDS